MSDISTIQRDFRKLTSKLRASLEQIPDSPVVRQLRNQFDQNQHRLCVHISAAAEVAQPNLLQDMTQLLPDEYLVVKGNELDEILHKEHGTKSGIYVCCFEDLANNWADPSTLPVLVLCVGEDQEREVRRGFRHLKNHHCVQLPVQMNVFMRKGLWLPKILFADKSRFYQEIIETALKVMEQRMASIKGRLILNQSKEIDVAGTDLKKLQREASILKQQMAALVKEEFLQLDRLVHDQFNPDGALFHEFYSDIENYRGFDENDDSRNTVYSIPKDYISAKKNTKREHIDSLVGQLVNNLEGRKKNVLAHVNQHPLLSHLEGEALCPKPFPAETVLGAFEREESILRDYEKRVPKKGIFQLLMELRTPLYVIFPLFIIARFISSTDEGTIDTSVTTMSGEPVVVISKMPESYKNNEAKFIASINRYLNEGSLVNETTGSEIFRFNLDKRGAKKEVVYSILEQENGEDHVVLPVESDRRLAIELLEANVLKITSRFNVIRELQKIPSILGPFRSLFGPVVLILVILYMRSRRANMNNEKIAVRTREQGVLRQDLAKDLRKLMSLSETTFQGQLRNYTRTFVDDASQTIDRIFGKEIQEEELRKTQELKLIKARDRNFQSDLKDMDAIRKGFSEILREFSHLSRAV